MSYFQIISVIPVISLAQQTLESFFSELISDWYYMSEGSVIRGSCAFLNYTVIRNFRTSGPKGNFSLFFPYQCFWMHFKDCDAFDVGGDHPQLRELLFQIVGPFLFRLLSTWKKKKCISGYLRHCLLNISPKTLFLAFF